MCCFLADNNVYILRSFTRILGSRYRSGSQTKDYSVGEYSKPSTSLKKALKVYTHFDHSRKLSDPIVLVSPAKENVN